MTDSWTLRRMVAGAAAAVLTALVVWNIATMSPQDWVLLALLVAALAFPAFVGWWFALKGHRPASRALIWAGCKSALVVGGIGLVAGMVVPMIMQPSANQGPLVGILITGPVGAVLGFIAGVTFHYRRRQVGA